MRAHIKDEEELDIWCQVPRQQCDPVTRQVCEQVAKEVRFIIYQLRRFTLSACRAFIPIDDAQSYRMRGMFLRFSLSHIAKHMLQITVLALIKIDIWLHLYDEPP